MASLRPLVGTPEHEHMLAVVRKHGLDPERMPLGGDDAWGYTHVLESPAELLPGESATFERGRRAEVRRPWPTPEAGREIRQATWDWLRSAAEPEREPEAPKPKLPAAQERLAWVVEGIDGYIDSLDEHVTAEDFGRALTRLRAIATGEEARRG